MRTEPFHVAPVVTIRLAAAGTLDVHDADDVGGHVLDTDVAAGLEHDGDAGVTEPRHQRVDVALQQRLAAGDLHQRAAVRGDGLEDIVHAHLAPFRKRVGRIAPGAPEVARGQTDENAGAAGMGRFPLDRVEDLVDRQHLRTLYGRRLEYGDDQTNLLLEAHLNDLP